MLFRQDVKSKATIKTHAMAPGALNAECQLNMTKDSLGVA